MTAAKNARRVAGKVRRVVRRSLCAHRNPREVGATSEGLGRVLVFWCPACGGLKKTMTNWAYTDYPWELPTANSEASLSEASGRQGVISSPAIAPLASDKLRRLVLPPVLDACCGSRMFWFDRADSRAVFVDKRCERHTLPDVSSAGGSRELVIAPDVQADFTSLPFPDSSFALVVFDPPHFERNGARSWVGLKYGTLAGDWREMLRRGFAECFRVLRSDGVLVFKWCADEIPVSQILALTPERPLFGHKSGKNSRTHWITFIRQNISGERISCPPKDSTK